MKNICLLICFVAIAFFAIESSFAQEGQISGSGTVNYVPKFIQSTTLANSTIYDNGNVGIGTNTPDYKVDLDSYANDFIARLSNGSTTGSGIIIKAGGVTGGYPILDLRNFSNYTKMTVLGNGNVGIGTSTPQETLDLNGKLLMHDNIKLNGNWLSNDGGNEGVFVSASGNVGIGFSSPTEKLDVYGKLNMRDNIKLNGNWLSNDGGNEGIYIDANGYVGIGTANTSTSYKLRVAGGILANEVKIVNSSGADFVFQDGYSLPEIGELEKYINENKHLPDIPTAEEMQEDGFEMGTLQIKLLQKIEELTLYIIELNKQNEELRKIIIQKN